MTWLLVYLLIGLSWVIAVWFGNRMSENPLPNDKMRSTQLFLFFFWGWTIIEIIIEIIKGKPSWRE
jgi:predicted membrane channel-forming protein YqfA (hemolysin III family)